MEKEKVQNTAKPPVDDYALYADDDPDDRATLLESFESHVKDKKLETVSTGDELLDYLGRNIQAKGLPCLIILDQNMPGMTGDEVLEVLKTNEWYKDIPVVMFSTSSHMNVELLKKYGVGLEIKPDHYSGWESLALLLLKHCDRFKRSVL